MRAGEMRHLVSVWEYSRKADDVGGAIESWSNTGTLWCYVEVPSGDDVLKSDQLMAVRRFQVLTRFTESIKVGMRLQHGLVLMVVRVVLPSAKRDQVAFICEEVVTD